MPCCRPSLVAILVALAVAAPVAVAQTLAPHQQLARDIYRS